MGWAGGGGGGGGSVRDVGKLGEGGGGRFFRHSENRQYNQVNDSVCSAFRTL